MKYKLTLRDDITVRDAIGTPNTLALESANGVCMYTENIDFWKQFFNVEPIGQPFHVAIQETGKVRRVEWQEHHFIQWSDQHGAYVDHDRNHFTNGVNGEWLPT